MVNPLYAKLRKWNKKRYLGGDGILIGSDLTQEWLLPWWWSHYSRHNSYPVTWIDFGLSEKMREWCRERGELVFLPVATDLFVVPREEVAPERAAVWEGNFGVAFWPCRCAWFKKPFAFLQTPYERTLWIDNDCEVRGSLGPVFEACNHPSGIAMCLDIRLSQYQEELFNSGVVSYRWGLPLIQTWADRTIDSTGEFMGDQDLLSQLLIDQNISIQKLPDRYNAGRRKPHEGALIVHWYGSNGKKIIESQLVQERLDSLI